MGKQSTKPPQAPAATQAPAQPPPTQAAPPAPAPKQTPPAQAPDAPQVGAPPQPDQPPINPAAHRIIAEQHRERNRQLQEAHNALGGNKTPEQRRQEALSNATDQMRGIRPGNQSPFQEAVQNAVTEAVQTPDPQSPPAQQPPAVPSVAQTPPQQPPAEIDWGALKAMVDQHYSATQPQQPPQPVAAQTPPPEEPKAPAEPDWTARQEELRQQITERYSSLGRRTVVNQIIDPDTNEVVRTLPAEERSDFDPKNWLNQRIIDLEVKTVLSEERQEHQNSVRKFHEQRHAERQGIERKQAEAQRLAEWDAGVTDGIETFIRGGYQLADNTRSSDHIPRDESGNVPAYFKATFRGVVREVENDPNFIKWAENYAQQERARFVAPDKIRRNIVGALVGEAFKNLKPLLTSVSKPPEVQDEGNDLPKDVQGDTQTGKVLPVIQPSNYQPEGQTPANPSPVPGTPPTAPLDSSARSIRQHAGAQLTQTFQPEAGAQ